MKTSKYNIFVNKGGRKFVYNQLHSSLLEIDDELARLLKASDINSMDEELKDELLCNGIICEDSLNEYRILLARNKQTRFSSDLARVTILPTIDCNFHCWYCYENHKKSTMTEEDCKHVLLFCKQLVEQGNLKVFHLDWFGGEPLLFFAEIVYPLSKQIKDLCKKHEVHFLNTITTNGALMTNQMIAAFKEIDLFAFQITLDGGRKFHNKTRFSKDMSDSFSVIVNNITQICRTMSGVDMTVRINYTPKNLQSIDDIIDAFPEDVRSQLSISPQIVWQFKDEINGIDLAIKRKIEKFISKGYKKSIVSLNCSPCYTENMKQFVINYDLYVYKCTARDFKKELAIGKIQKDGTLKLLPHYYDYFISSGMEEQDCQECDLLPSCNGVCLQKRVESYQHKCDKDKILESISNKVLLYIQQQENMI